MSDAPSLIMLQFLAWVAERPRSYGEAMDAWRTSCPRLSVWEDATLDGLVRRAAGPGGETAVRLTTRGQAVLDAGRTAAPAPHARHVYDTSKINLNHVSQKA